MCIQLFFSHFITFEQVKCSISLLRSNSVVMKHAESNVNAKAVFLGQKLGYWRVRVYMCGFPNSKYLLMNSSGFFVFFPTLV